MNMSPAVQKFVNERAACGQLELDELSALADGLLSFPWSSDAIVVEIGTYKGRTPVMMAKVLATAGHRPTIVSIDAFDRVIPTRLNCRGSYDHTIRNILEAGLGGQCIVISASSNDVTRLIPPQIGALIIDGWHSYDQTTADLENYMPKLLLGGFALVDDYCDFYPDVIRAIDEYLARHGDMTLERKLNKGVILRKSS